MQAILADVPDSVARSSAPDPNCPRTMALGQFMTPAWVAEAIVEKHFSRLCASDLVIDPSCGDGRFLRALPDEVPAIGCEIDRDLAEKARRLTGRTILDGDFLHVPLPAEVTAVIGNPPFKAGLIEKFIDRAHALLPDGGRMGFILPAYVLQTSTKVLAYARRWAIHQELMPRNIFPRLKLPIVFALFTKTSERRLVGFFLYEEAADVRAMGRCYREILQAGRVKGSVWKQLVAAALRNLGGAARLEEIYAELEPHRPSASRFWKEKIRQILQIHSDFCRIEKGEWALAA
jgi:site-specific DNA-methyltransferase (adenine-specific)